MDDMEELKRKKKYLELQKEVVALEKKKRINKAIDFLSYKITVPLFVLGLFGLVVSASTGDGDGAIIAIIFLIPFALKFFWKT